MTRCKLKDSAMNKKYWAEEIKTAAYVRNSIDNELNKEKSPYDVFCHSEWQDSGNLLENCKFVLLGCSSTCNVCF